MIKNRGRNVIVRSQFNIHGSRGKSVKPFITDYVSRDDACEPSTSFMTSNGTMEQGDGVAFTLNNSSVSREETLRIADVVEDYFLQGDRAIQQMVISFDPEYLKEQGIVDDSAEIQFRGDYQGQYDDVRLRHAVRKGVQAMCDLEGYRDPQMIAAIQHDTLHLHVHVVVYENHPDVARTRGKEEKGVIKPSSFNQLTHEIDRALMMSKSSTIPNQKKLIPEQSTSIQAKPHVQPIQLDTSQWLRYLQIFQELETERKEAMEREQEEVDKELEQERMVQETVVDLDTFMENFYHKHDPDKPYN